MEGWGADGTLSQSSRFPNRRICQTAYIGAASTKASRNQIESMGCSSTENVQDTVQSRARGKYASSGMKTQCQLTKQEAKWRRRAEWDLEIEICNAAPAHGKNAGDGTAEAGKPLNGCGKNL